MRRPTRGTSVQHQLTGRRRDQSRSTSGRRNKLGTFAISSSVVCMAAPMAVSAGLIPTSYASTGIIAIPIAIALMGLVLTLFSVGYSAVSRRITNAGAFYAYIAQGLGRPAGIAAGWIATVAYNLLQVGLYGMFGVVVKPLADSLLGTDLLAWWGYALIAWAFVAVLGLLKIRITVTILAVLVIAESVLILIFDGANLANPADGTVSVAALDPSNLLVTGVGSLAVIATTCFVGFESATVYSENARDTRRTVRRTTYVCLGIIGAIYVLSGWSQSVTVGPARIGDVAAQDPDLFFTLAATHLAPGWATLGRWLFVTSLFAAMVSYHNAVARYMFSLGRESALPTFLGTLDSHGTPRWASLTQSTIGFAVIIGYAALHLDPQIQLFFWLGTTGGFGILLLLTLTSAAIIGYFRRHPGENIWRARVAPATSLVVLVVLLAIAMLTFDTLLGVPADDPARWLFPLAYAVVGAAGLAWALVLRATRPGIYRGIGLGADCDTGRTTPLTAHVGSHELPAELGESR